MKKEAVAKKEEVLVKNDLVEKAETLKKLEAARKKKPTFKESVVQTKKLFVTKWKLVKTFVINLWDSETISIKNMISNFMFFVGAIILRTFKYSLMFILFLTLMKIIAWFFTFSVDTILNQTIPKESANIIGAMCSAIIIAIVLQWVEKIKKSR